VQTGCVWSNERIFNVAGDCAVNQLVTQSVSWILDSAPPLITATASFVDYGCAGDVRSFADSFAALGTSDADGADTVIATNLVDELRVTNGCHVTVTRLWRAIDCCDNIHDAVESYAYDITPASFSVNDLADLDLGCIASTNQIPQPDFSALSSSCPGLSVTLASITPLPGSTCTTVFERVYNIGTTCASGAVTQRVTYVLNTAPPVITAVAPFIDYACAGDQRSLADSMAGISTSDADGNATVLSTNLVTELRITNDCSVLVQRTWRVEDCCNDFDEAVETYRYLIPPANFALGNLPDLDLGCITTLTQIPPPDLSGAGIQSSCPINVTLLATQALPAAVQPTDGCAAGYERVYQLAADCDSGTITQRVFFTLNTAPPQFTTIAPFVDFGCAGDQRSVADSSNALVVVDADGPGTIQSIQLVSETRVTNNCQVVVSRLWRTFDCCDQYHERLETYAYTIPPMAPSVAQLCPPDMDLGCINGAGDIPAGVSTLGAPISTGCYPTVTFVGDGPAVPAADGCSVTFTRTNRITDICGNLEECSFTITYLIDSSPPSIDGIPAFVDFGCDGDLRPVPLTNQIVASDESQVVATYLVQEVRITNACDVVVTRTWRVEDCCGKFDLADETYRYTMRPNDPTFGPLADINVGCITSLGQIPGADVSLLTVNAACQTDASFISDTPVTSTLGGCYEAIDRVYAVTDLCQANATITQRIDYILDLEPPRILSVAPYIDNGCGGDPRPVPLTNLVVATDVEGHLVSTQLVSELRTTNNCRVTVDRLWRVEDCCGQFDLAREVYEYIDDPMNIMVESLPPIDMGCIDDRAFLPQPNPTLVSANSSCTLQGVAFLSDTEVVITPCSNLIERVYRVTDICSNTETITQLITFVVNNTDLQIIATEPAMDFGCQPENWLVPPPDAAATNAVVDNSAGQVVATNWLGDTYATNGCDVVVTRTWQVTDCCANTAQATVQFTYTVLAVQAPTLTCPADLDLGCIQSVFQVPAPDILQLAVTGGCGAEIRHDNDGPITRTGCVSSFTRTYRVTDTCNQTSTCEPPTG